MVGALFLVATVAYATGAGFIDSILTAPDYLTQLYPQKGQLVTGVMLQFIDAAAVVGIAVLLFPILRKQYEAIAISYVGTRLIECILLLVAGISVLLFVPLSQAAIQAGATEAVYFQTIGALLLAASKLAFQIAMLALGVGSLPFCYALYQSKLIPPAMSMLGFIGYIALAINAMLEIFGYNMGVILFLPGGIFELIFPLWLLVKGLNVSASA
jgi:hypothetical protein